MVLVDSSVFIETQRRPNSGVARELAALLMNGEASVTGAVIMEYVQGARSDSEINFLIERLSSVDYLDTDQQVWIIAGQLSNRLMRSGQTLADFDVIIAATAIRHDVPLYTLDKGFERVAELILYEPTQV